MFMFLVMEVANTATLFLKSNVNCLSGVDFQRHEIKRDEILPSVTEKADAMVATGCCVSGEQLAAEASRFARIAQVFRRRKGKFFASSFNSEMFFPETSSKRSFKKQFL
jgi:hypothetical protein